MLTAEENERLTRVGRGTPMGELVRRFWLPFLQVSDIAEPDGPPVRVTLLGEQLVAFRDTCRTHRAHRPAVRSPLCQSFFRAQRRERPALHLPRLEIQRRRKMRRHAYGRCGERVQGQYPAHCLSRAGESGDPLDLHGTQGSNPGAAGI